MSGSVTARVVVTAASTGGKVITSTTSPVVAIATVPAGQKASATGSRTSSVAVTATASGGKVLTKAVTAPIRILATSNGGQDGSSNATALVEIVPSSVGGKRVTYAVTASVAITTSVVVGAFEHSLTGYSMDAGLDQSATWAAIILRMRMGQPVGDDVDSLKSLNRYAAFGSVPGQFIPSLTAPTQSLGTAAWSILAATGGLGILPNETTLPPVVSIMDVVSTTDIVLGVTTFSYRWKPDIEEVSGWEAIPEHSADGSTWAPVYPVSIQRPISQTPLEDGYYLGSWTTDTALTPAFNRIRMRLSNKSAGEWFTSSTIHLPERGIRPVAHQVKTLKPNVTLPTLGLVKNSGTLAVLSNADFTAIPSGQMGVLVQDLGLVPYEGQFVASFNGQTGDVVFTINPAELGAAPLVHTHSVSDVTGLQTALDGKEVAGAATASMSAHVAAANPHAQYALDSALTSGLASKANTVHTHAITDTTGLQSALDAINTSLSGKQAAGDYATLSGGVLAQAQRPVVGPAPVTLTDAATIATDASQGNHFRVTLGGNRTLGNPTNGSDGQVIRWELVQDATGSRTLTLGGAFELTSVVTAITLSTAAGARNWVAAVYNSTRAVWSVIALN